MRDNFSNNHNSFNNNNVIISGMGVLAILLFQALSSHKIPFIKLKWIFEFETYDGTSQTEGLQEKHSTYIVIATSIRSKRKAHKIVKMLQEQYNSQADFFPNETEFYRIGVSQHMNKADAKIGLQQWINWVQQQPNYLMYEYNETNQVEIIEVILST